MQGKDKTARSLQSDLDLYYPQKLLVSSTERKELLYLRNSFHQQSDYMYIIMD